MSTKKSKERNNSFVKKRTFSKNLRALKAVNRRNENHCKIIDILNKKWKVFRVSPLYNFSFNKLKVSEEKLNKEVNSKKKMTSNIVYKSNFTVNENIKVNDQHLEVLKVEVIKDEAQTAYLGHFISWNSSDTNKEDSVSLPILLVEAKTNEINMIHSAFCKLFDCDIQSVTFSLHALVSFFVKLLETPRTDIDVSQEQVTMEFGMFDCDVNDKIKVTLVLEATTVVFAVVMNSLQEKFTEITTMEIIWEFYNKILNHIYHIFNLDLVLAELKKVTFPDAFLTSDGQLKMSTDDAAISALNVLRHFTPINAVTNV